VDLELVELLGVGGFGEVWKAQNPNLASATPVALKFCLDAAAAVVLRNEAAVLDRVMRGGRHPGIVELQHTYLSANPPCLEYEYVEGGDLAGLIQEWHSPRGGGRPTPKQAATVMLRLAEIMAFAHRLDPPIVHRDLKPTNVLVQRTKKGGLAFRVADFGIGAVASSRAIEQTRRSQGVMESVVRGAYTPLYASPQQMRGERADTRDDVYALGIIWYQLLTGDLCSGAPSGLKWARPLLRRGMSEKQVRLLASCFEARAQDRPADAGVLMGQLAKDRGGGEEVVKVSPAPQILGEQTHRRPAPQQTKMPEWVQEKLAAGTGERVVPRERTTHQSVPPPLPGSPRRGFWLAGGIAATIVGTVIVGVALSLRSGQPVAHLPPNESPPGSPPKEGSIPQIPIGQRTIPSTEANFCFEGHTWPVLSVAYDPNGGRFLSGSSDGTVRLWDIARGKDIRWFKGHRSFVNSVAFSPDGQRALSGGTDHSVRLWEVSSGKEIWCHRGHADDVSSVGFSPDGRRALSGSWDTSILLWDVASGKIIHQFDGHTAKVWSVAFSPDGHRILSGGQDGTVRQWDVSTGREIYSLLGHQGAVHCVGFSPQGTLAFSDGFDSSHFLRLWESDSRKELLRLRGHSATVNCAAISPDGRLLLSGGYDDDHIVRVWDLRTGNEVQRLQGHTAQINSVAFSPDGRFALSAGSDNTIRLWKIVEPSSRPQLP
jgi:WD40 repeat protein